jgi:hypothetical protein
MFGSVEVVVFTKSGLEAILPIGSKDGSALCQRPLFFAIRSFFFSRLSLKGLALLLSKRYFRNHLSMSSHSRFKSAN